MNRNWRHRSVTRDRLVSHQKPPLHSPDCGEPWSLETLGLILDLNQWFLLWGFWVSASNHRSFVRNGKGKEAGEIIWELETGRVAAAVFRGEGTDWVTRSSGKERRLNKVTPSLEDCNKKQRKGNRHYCRLEAMCLDVAKDFKILYVGWGEVGLELSVCNHEDLSLKSSTYKSSA